MTLLAVWMTGDRSAARAQDAADVPVDAETVESLLKSEPPVQPNPPSEQPSGIDLLSLTMRGGAFMIPIGIMSFLVVTLAAERLISLRRKRVIPTALTQRLRELMNPVDRFNPSTALGICREYPSPAASAFEAMLMRTGQPLADIESAAHESIQRDADDCASPIRWLSLSAAVTPLMGLLGTVWGMIVAFHESTTLTADRSRSEQLSEGIYTALVTTLAGLIVAIPAALAAQYLENRLAKLFHQIERFSFDLAPCLTRFVGRLRLEPDGTLRQLAGGSAGSAASANPTASPSGGISGSGAPTGSGASSMSPPVSSAGVAPAAPPVVAPGSAAMAKAPRVTR